MSTPGFDVYPRTLAAGDAALVVELGEGIDESVNRRVHGLALAVERQSLPAIIDLIPSYRSLLIAYDPRMVTFGALSAQVAALEQSADRASLPAPRTVEVPTCYGGEYGPDLPFVASHTGLTPEQLVAIHAGGTYTVFMMGFSPGFAYLGGMAPEIAAPRLKTPRTSIPAGSVGIAQQQTGIYPVESPGGWQLIGRTPLPLFDPRRTPPTLLQPGDRIRFVPVNEARYRELVAQFETNVGANSDDELRRGSPQPEGPAEGGADTEAAFEVIEPGGLTTVQDLGRYGFERYGVPVSGAMDSFALRVANLLVDNGERQAGLEMTITGPELLFHRGAVVAVTGADMQPRIDGRFAPMWCAFRVPAGAVLSFRGLRGGARAYMAIAGGIGVAPVLGSRSTYTRSHFGGLDGRPLAQGDRLPLAETPSVRVRHLPSWWQPTYAAGHRLRVVLGPQRAAFTDRGVNTLLTSAYTVSRQSDRMGYRLTGPAIEHRAGADIVSDGTPAGAVQVAGDGLPLVLLADRGTTGGYAKIATIITADLPRLAQCQADDRVFFDAVTVEDAYAALARQERVLDELRAARLFLAASSNPNPGIATTRAIDPAARHQPDATRPAFARAPLPGKILAVGVKAGELVSRAQRLCVLEAMKMHNAIVAPRAGRVAAVRVAAGDDVEHGQVLIEIE